MTDLSVQLSMPADMAAQLRADEAVAAMLQHYDVDSNEMAQTANTDMREAIERVAVLKKMKGEFVKPAKEIIARAEALFDPAIGARQSFADGLRAKLEVWTTEQRRLADEARRQAEASDRKRRQEAEAAAAAERAKAQAEAQEQRRKAAEAEAERKRLEAEGKAAEAAKAAAQAAALQQQAQATVANAEVKAQETILMAAAQTAVVQAPEKVQGFSMVANWVCELAPDKTETDAVIAIAKAITEGRMDLVPLLTRNEKASNKLADALKSAMSVPCLVAVNRPYSRSVKTKG